MGWGLKSGCAPSLCPADPRAQRNYCVDVHLEDCEQSRWGFCEDDSEDGEIVVSCSVHNHNDEEFEEEIGKRVAAEARVAAEVAASRETVQGAGFQTEGSGVK